MVERLRSISKRIHWSLVLRAVIFGAAWFWLPFWAFFLVALYLYLVPLFQPGKLLLLFLMVVFFAFVETPALWLAILLGAFFYLILGIKDLILVDRPAAYETLVLIAIFLLFVRFFSYFSSGFGSGALWTSLLLSFFLFFLMRSFLSYEKGMESKSPRAKRRDIFSAALALLAWQISLILLYLPLSFFYQAATAFIFTAVLVEWSKYYIDGDLSRTRMLLGFSTFFVVLVVVLGTASWGL